MVVFPRHFSESVSHMQHVDIDMLVVRKDEQPLPVLLRR